MSAKTRVIQPKKIAYGNKLLDLLQEYTGILIVEADHVGSHQMQQIRLALRGKAVVLMGKNTQIRRVVREASENYHELQRLLPIIRGNVGLIFTNGNIKEIRDIVQEFKVPAAARAGVIAPVDVFVPPGPTGCDPGQTDFFQALGIATKIVRSNIEIVSEVHLIKKGEKVGSSEVTLLSKLNIKPFSYGLVCTHVFDNGTLYSSEVLDISQDDLLKKFLGGVSRIACLSLQIGYPTLPAIPHIFARTMKKLIAISLVTDYSFKEADKIKDLLSNPDALAAAQAAAAGPSSGSAPAAAVAAPAAKAESEEESDGPVGGGGLFGDESDEESD